ncbi:MULTISPECIES: aspartate/glutamate racemase family protein [Sphingobium]|uniref:Aspartate/glutamate racemase family protein n=1 Tax=Sphingobium tyrosinilyticum TaxID=2715436 RepID=A0ABV9F966_9SPHN|nr:amino acid racemase [Sphingobium sp. EP60837]ANI78547.1 Aspartate racemase [Sphingobium sp. EP60837]
MQKLGLIGGLSWTSTARYYQIINQAVYRAKGGQHSAPLLIESLDFADIGRSTTDEEWAHAAQVLTASARRLEQAGAQALLICANSMHRVYDEVQSGVDTPIINIADAVGRKMKADGVHKAALIGTRNVMTEKFYRQRLVGHGISLLPPDLELAERIDRIVYEELTIGKVSRDSERYMRSELTDIAKENVQAAILACTELEMIVDVKANVLPIYDGTAIHARAGVDVILGD